MKFTKFFMAAFAAMALASCSKEAEALSPDSSIAPGDALVTFEMGKTTTYATKEEELAIGDMKVMAFFTNVAGTEVVEDVTGGWNIDAPGKFAWTFKQGSYAPNTNVELYFIANSEISLDDTWSADDLLTQVENKEIYAINGGALALNGGMTSFNKGTAPLQSGTPTTQPLVLKRLAARLYVENTNILKPIAGYTVNYTGVAAGANFKFEGFGTTGEAPEYTITGSGTGQFGDKEAIGYFYPSVAGDKVTVTVSNGSTTREATFSPVSNKNYKLKITPAGDDASVDFDLSIRPWEDVVGEDLEADFTQTIVPINPEVAKIAGVVSAAGSTVELAPAAFGTGSDYIDIADFFKDGETVWNVTDMTEIVKTRSAIDTFASVTADSRLKFDFANGEVRLALMPNNTGSTLNYNLKATLESNGETKEQTLTITQKSLAAVPAGLTQKFGGEDWMVINTQNTGDIADDIALFDKINATSGADFTTKWIAYAGVSGVQHEEATGALSKQMPGTTGLLKATCPAGFAIPSADLVQKSLFGLTPVVYNGLTMTLHSNIGTGTVIGDHSIDHVRTYTAAPHAGMGYFLITDAEGAKIVLSWRGSRNGVNTLENHRISALASSSFSTVAGGTMGSPNRFIFGSNTGVGGVLQLTVYAALDANASQLVRCVKVSPTNYWAQ